MKIKTWIIIFIFGGIAFAASLNGNNLSVRYYIVNKANNNEIHDIASAVDGAETKTYRFGGDKKADYLILRVKTSTNLHNEVSRIADVITPNFESDEEETAYFNTTLNTIDSNHRNIILTKVSQSGIGATGNTVGELYEDIIKSNKWK